MVEKKQNDSEKDHGYRDTTRGDRRNLPKDVREKDRHWRRMHRHSKRREGSRRSLAAQLNEAYAAASFGQHTNEPNPNSPRLRNNDRRSSGAHQDRDYYPRDERIDTIHNPMVGGKPVATQYERRQERPPVVRESPEQVDANGFSMDNIIAIDSQPHKDPEGEQPPPKKITKCPRCGRVMDTYRRCGFCFEKFCHDGDISCYEMHDCESSYRCSQCGRRVPRSLTVVGAKCHQYFCGRRCLDSCWQKNQWESACEDCDAKTVKILDKKVEDRDSDRDYNKPAENEPVMPDDDCDGYCNECEEEDCEIRCRNGKCKKCPDSELEACAIQCIFATDPCSRWRCRGFKCKYRRVSGSGCDDDGKDCIDCEEEGCYYWPLTHMGGEEE